MNRTGITSSFSAAWRGGETGPLWQPLSVGRLRLQTNLVMAPMAGLTDKVFRFLVRRAGGCGLAYTEMVSSEALTRGIDAARELLDLSMDLHPAGVQIYGSDPGRLSAAAVMVQEEGADIIDINMGCPAAKIVRNGAGAALMRDVNKVSKVVKGIVDSVSVPVTVKLRLGWNEREINVVQVCQVCQDAGASALTVHCRTRSGGFRKPVRWDLLRDVTRALTIPVFANGDIQSPLDAERAMEMSSASGVMIGRGALRNPWIFQQIAGILAPGEIPCHVKRKFILEHYRMMSDLYPGRKAKTLHFMRVFAGWYTRGLMYGARLRRRISETKTPELFIEAIEEFFASASALQEASQ